MSPFLLRLLYTALKVGSYSIDRLKDVLKDFELKSVSDASLIQKTTERLNILYLNKYIVQLIEHYMQRVPLNPKAVW